jgi:hypothetical protein
MNNVKEIELIKTNLLSVDALNDGDGWSWNNWHTIEEGIYLSEDTLSSPRKLLKYCRDVLQILTPESAGQLQIEDDQYNVCIQLRTGQTLFAFCYGEFL